MPVKRIHPCKGFLTTFTSKGTIICMQLLVSFTVVLTGKALVTSWPMAKEWLFLVVRTNVAYEYIRSVHAPGNEYNIIVKPTF